MESDEKSRQSVMLVTHHFTTGQPDLFIDFLRKKVPYVVVVRHPFYYANDLASRIEFYSCGIKSKETEFYPLKMREVLLYFKDLMLTLFIAMGLRTKFKLYVGVDCLNALAGLILQKMGYVEKVVMYTIDLPVRRFNNSILSLLYHRLDIFCANRCDRVWDLSPRMELVRRAYGRRPNRDKPLIVPSVYSVGRKLLFKESSLHRLVFVGHLKESQGLQLVIQSMPEIIKNIPDAKLMIVGTGPYEDELKRLVEELRMEDRVFFFGYVDDHKHVEEILCEGGIGIAPYMPDPVGITMYADPMKPKVYIACGLPIIITRVPWIAALVEKYGAGAVIEYDKDEFTGATIKLLTDRKYYVELRKNALKLAQNFEPEKVFASALIHTMPHFDKSVNTDLKT